MGDLDAVVGRWCKSGSDACFSVAVQSPFIACLVHQLMTIKPRGFASAVPASTDSDALVV